MLGAPWFVSGEVIHGAERGRELGFPTANLRLDPSCGLKHGIYAVRVAVGDMRYDGVASFGVRPMFDDGAPLLEVHLFDFDGDLYGQAMEVAFIGWLRPEQKLESVEALKRQMKTDASQARDALKRAGKAFRSWGDCPLGDRCFAPFRRGIRLLHSAHVRPQVQSKRDYPNAVPAADGFPMRARPQKSPRSGAGKDGLCRKCAKRPKPREIILHDGPPYANGNIRRPRAQ